MTEKAKAVQRMQDYIEQHLCEEITLAQLAEASLYSPWYSYRLFQQYTDLTPADYIRRLRLSKSALRLRDESCRILDVALDMGFGSVDGYQRAFYREFGCNPKEFATKPIPLPLFVPYGVIYRELRKEPKEYDGVVPDGFEAVEFPAARYLMFQGQPFEEEDYCQAITEVQQAIDNYSPAALGLVWDEANPRIQLEPVGTRGYIELCPVRPKDA